jgi:uncharacterized membrane protein/mono/diheme cytochrome c family protein
MSDPPEIALFLGRFHPLLVHLPIGFLLIGFLLELFSRLPRFAEYRHAVAFVLFLGAWSSILAAGLGYLLSLGGGYDEDLLALHQWLGIGVAVAAIGALLLKTRLNKQTSRVKERAYGLTLTLTVLLMMGAGHYGGSLTHGADYLTAYLPTTAASFTSGTASKNKVKLITNLPEAVVYNDIIQPIFDSRCTSCHNPAKKKGDLQLHAYASLLLGGKDGPVIEAGQAAKSELYKRLLLPPEDKHAMPPKGKEPLTESELQLIAWWINQGATADKKVKQLTQTPTIKAALATRTAGAQQWANPVFAKKIDPASPQDLEAANAAGFLVLPLANGQPFLRAQRKMSAPPPKNLSALAPLAAQLVALDLNGTPMTEAHLEILATFENLTRLHLENTQTTDAGIARLGKLPFLDYLNLYGNPITDKGLQELEKAPHLRQLYLWQTQVTPAGIAALQQKKQQLRIFTGISTRPDTSTQIPDSSKQLSVNSYQ